MKIFKCEIQNCSIVLLLFVVISFSSVFAVESANSDNQKGIELEEKINKIPWIGIITKDHLKEKVRKRESDGVLVDDFIEKGPAKISGIDKGDIIKSVDGQPVKNQNEFEKAISTKKVGDKIKIKLERSAEEIEIEVTLEDTWSRVKEILTKLGFKVKVVEVSDRPVNIIISDIKKDSISYSAKLEKGDLLVGINRKAFRNLEEFGEVTSQIKLDETIFLTIIHNRSVLTKELRMSVAKSKK